MVKYGSKRKSKETEKRNMENIVRIIKVLINTVNRLLGERKVKTWT